MLKMAISILGDGEVGFDFGPLALQRCHIICLCSMILPLIASKVDLLYATVMSYM